MVKIEVMKKIISQICWACGGKGCKVCNNTGKWEESINYIIYEVNGKKYAIDSDNIG
jgi:hypothetical protein